MESKTEECASLPNILADVNRYHKIDAKYMNLEGDEISETLEGFKARVFQNSLDHL